ncbi:aminoglycoside phosphotransferase family protein [Vibrio hippocampi]|uniref:Choline kinase n=1 Tax=Vibrio hippocampi TaxID=654686 RepID=A0ABM8ZKL8_9VIBR|nr:aminoglycoside phosphotransferase family protein [Vibrio hippocampi]CAH0527403.1 hypothetical protein VHP8226_02691 [Vibrio hippocampi]
MSKFSSSLPESIELDGERFCVVNHEIIQPLWSDYGYLVRCFIEHPQIPSVILKSIQLPSEPAIAHPKGWNTPASHQRKLDSYQVEFNWYKNYASQQPLDWVPQCLMATKTNQRLDLILEDLKLIDCANSVEMPSQRHIKLAIEWLACFHAYWLGCAPERLWSRGTYWHLGTRQNEFEAMQQGRLKQAAPDIAERIYSCRYQTLVHGDAKLANFCFDNALSKTMAVDFQYVGQGIGVQDLVLLLTSALDFTDPQLSIEPWVDYYFEQLEAAVIIYHPTIDSSDLERCWRPLVGLAWADFQRFLLGWSPTHWKINPFTQNLVSVALDKHDL